MAKTLGCKDAGMECEFRVTSNDEGEIMEVVGTHLKRHHADKLEGKSDEEMAAMMEETKKLIHDAPVE